MKIIGLISDNHSYSGNEIIENLKDCHEIWHAGDIGDIKSIQEIKDICTFRAVYGNIDDTDIRLQYPLDLDFECEGMKIFMTHIGGFPGKYNARVKKILLENKPDIYICGHSHICKVMPDKELKLLHMNPGAYGHHGFHVIRTILKFEIDNSKIQNLRAIELGRRGTIEE